MRGPASLLAVAVCLAALAGLPTAGAHEPDPQAVYKFTEPGQAEGWSNATLGPEPSDELLERFDQDGDEHVSQAEARNLEAFLEHSGEDAEARTAWDGQAPAESEVLDVTATNAEGPIEGTEGLHLHSRSQLTYESEDALQDHVWSRLTGDADEGRHLKVEAPPGYEPEPRQGFTTVETDGALLEGRTTSGEDVAVTFTAEDAGSAEAPVPIAATLLAGLVAALAVGRRPR